jgi:signal transduction histidine kinase
MKFNSMNEGIGKVIDTGDRLLSTEEKPSLLEQLDKEKSKKEELEKKLETANKLLHLVAHDLRGPIGTVNEMLKYYIEDFSELTDEEKLNGMTLLSNDLSKTFRLTVDLIEFAYYQNNEIKPVISELKLLEQIESSIDPLLYIAKQKQITFNPNGINKESKILADSKMLQIVIRNLSSNAIKFTNPGGNISITSDKVNNNIEISVIDDGIGLSEKEMDKLFDKIGESKPGTNREKGTGFGLNFCSNLVKKMGGNIRVESAEGHGAKFIVSLPAVEK